jgi:hypothetical protein
VLSGCGVQPAEQTLDHSSVPASSCTGPVEPIRPGIGLRSCAHRHNRHSQPHGMVVLVHCPGELAGWLWVGWLGELTG